jgi:putative hydrolase of the HAD superfamily
MRLSMIEAVLFDLGNTLVYSNPEDTFQRILATQGITKSLEEIRNAMIKGTKEFDIEGHEGLSAHEFYTQCNMVQLKHLSLEGSEAKEIAENINIQWWKFAEFHVYSEVKDTLQRLKQKGLKIGLITGGFEEDIEMILPKTGLDKFFDVKVGVNTTGKRKPHPRAFMYALKQLGVKPREAVFVGDNFEADYLGARKAGMMSVLIKRKDQPLQRLYTDNCLKLPLGIRTIEKLDEIFDILNQVNP